MRPIFLEHCFSCHNQETKKSDLSLAAYGSLMAGGASGAIVAAGDPDSSRLWALISHAEEPKMPPEQDKLPQAKLDTIKAWIVGGALENNGSVAKAMKKPTIDLGATAGAAKPEGPPPMPEKLSRQPAVYTPRAAAVTALACSPWAPLAAVAGQKQIVLYNTDSGELLGVLAFPEGVPHVLKFSRSGSLLLAGGGIGGKSGSVVVFDVKTGNRVFQVGEELDVVLAADINEDHSRIALGGPGRVVRIYSTADGSLLHEIKKHTEWIYAVEFSPDGVLLATADRNGGLFVWEAETAPRVPEPFRPQGRRDRRELASRLERAGQCERRRRHQTVGNGRRQGDQELGGTCRRSQFGRIRQKRQLGVGRSRSTDQDLGR